MPFTSLFAPLQVIEKTGLTHLLLQLGDLLFRTADLGLDLPHLFLPGLFLPLAQLLLLTTFLALFLGQFGQR